MERICAECEGQAGPLGISSTVLHAARCADSPVHFLDGQAHIYNQDNEDLVWRLWGWQRLVLGDFLSHLKIVELKTRGIGMTWLTAGYAVWAAAMNGRSVIIGSRKEEVAKDLLARCKYIARSLLPVFPIPTIRDMETMVRFLGNGVIQSETASKDMARSYHPTIFILDEWAAIEQDWDATSAVMGAAGDEGQVIGFSTPRGFGNQFELYYHGAVAGTNSFFHRRLHWREMGQLDPAWRAIYNEDWYKRQCANCNNDPVRIAQELDCDFVQSGTPVFSLLDINAVWGWKGGQIGHRGRDAAGHERVIVAVDPASGMAASGGDETSITVIDGAGNEIHHEAWRKPATEAREALFHLLSRYQEPVVVVERNGLGLMYIDWLKGGKWQLRQVETTSGQKGELPPSSYHLGRSGAPPIKHWWSVPKQILITALQADMTDRSFRAFSPQTRDQMIGMVRTSTDRGIEQYGAGPGQHDDSVMSLALGRWAWRKQWARTQEEQRLVKPPPRKDWRAFRGN